MCPPIRQRFFADVLRDDDRLLDDVRREDVRLREPEDVREPDDLRDPDDFLAPEDLRDPDDFRDGTLPPLLRASLSPIAIACFRLVTRRPEPLFSVPLFLLRIVDSTFLEADLPYFAMCGQPPARSRMQMHDPVSSRHRPYGRDGYLPPVTSMKVPVEYDASSDSSQRIARATSSARPPRFIGTNAFTRSTRFGSPPVAWISV